jgi:flagellar hook-associated protein 3 FlgL
MSQIRLSSAQIYGNSVKTMLNRQGDVHRTQEQIASNKRLLTPADDPIAATRILQLNQELAQIEQYNKALSGLENRLQREEVALDGISELVLKAQELITQSGNAGMNKDQRGYLAVELQNIVDNMAQLMNSKDASGEYVFAGFQGRDQPFVQGADGRYRYAGDEGQRHIRIGPTTTVAASDSGHQVFMDIPSAEKGIQASAGPNNRSQPPATIAGERVHDRAAFEAFYPESVVIEFQSRDDINPPGMNYTIRQVSDGRVLAENEPFTAGSTIQFKGVSVRINGNPEKGDTFMVDSTNRKGLLEGLEDFVRELKSLSDSPEDRAALADRLGGALVNLDNAQQLLLQTRSDVGSRLNVVDNARNNNADFKLVTQQALSELADLDYAEAISRLTMQSFVLEAAQSSFARINRLSLFDYI